MTAALHAVASPWSLAAYALLCVLVLGANHVGHRKPSPSWTDLTVEQPPVPEPDAEWLAVWPDAVDDDALCDAEFVSLIATTWDWPDREDAQ